MNAEPVTIHRVAPSRVFNVTLMLGLMFTFIGGCRSMPKPVVEIDSRVRRLAEDGRELYAEGDVEAAIEKYQAAVLRAWAMDDPTESGTGAYNLAACWTSAGEGGLARDWLADARVELTRAGDSVGNVWLLEAKIATQEGRYEDASRYLDRSSCTQPPCESPDDRCGCPTPEGCRECPLSCIPCVGPKLEAKRAIKHCQDGFEAQIQLARARLAAEQFDLARATHHFTCACEQINDLCSHELHAESHNVAAMIHVARDEYLQAARHFDLEAKHLRLAGNYREVSGSLERAAAAYQKADRPSEAAQRWNRVARIYLGRDDAKKAWEFLRMASEIVDSRSLCDDDSIRIRLSLVARQIEARLHQVDP